MRVGSTGPGVPAPSGLAQALSPPPTRPPAAQRPTLDSILALADRERLAKAREEGAALVAKLGEVEDKARTARRDALVKELQRLMEMAATLRKIADPRMAGDMAQSMARQIAGIARQLADAEQALPPGQRSNLAARAAAFQAPPPAPGGPAAPATTPDTNPGTTPAATPGAGNASASAGEARRAGREATALLLTGAADLLDMLRRVVRRAERWEAVLDPDAAEDRRRAARDIARDAADVRGLAGRLGAGTISLSA